MVSHESPQLPDDFGRNLPLSLQDLYLSESHFLELPTWIARLTGLQGLFLSNNGDLRELPPWLGDLAELRSLGLSFMHSLPPVLPEFLGRLSRLTRLAILGTLHREIPSSVAELPHLTIDADAMVWDGNRWWRSSEAGSFPCVASMYNVIRAKEDAEKTLELEDAA